MYQLNKKARNKTITTILATLPKNERGEKRAEVNEIVDLFEEQDANALGVLHRAAEKGRFEEYIGKLKDYYQREGKDVPVDERPIARFQPAGELSYWLKRNRNGKADNPNLPNEVKNLIEHPESIKMELFFAKCYEEIMGDQVL